MWVRNTYFALSLLLAFLLGTSYGTTKTVLVLTQQGVSQYNAVLEGVKEGIKNDRIIFNVVDVNDEKRLQKSIADERSYDLILSVGTRASRIAVDTFKERPVIFAMVLNPVQEGILSSARVTGISARIEPEMYIEYAKKIQPQIKRIGILYTPAFFQDYIAGLKSYSEHHGIEIVDAAVDSKKEFIDRFKWVVDKDIDLFFILPDFKIYDANSTQYTLINTFKSGIPCIGPSASFVQSGALWALTISPFHIGQQAGQMVDEVLDKNEVPPWNYAQNNQLSVNLLTAEKLDVDVPKSVLEAEDVIKFGK